MFSVELLTSVLWSLTHIDEGSETEWLVSTLLYFYPVTCIRNVLDILYFKNSRTHDYRLPFQLQEHFHALRNYFLLGQEITIITLRLKVSVMHFTWVVNSLSHFIILMVLDLILIYMWSLFRYLPTKFNIEQPQTLVQLFQRPCHLNFDH